MSTGSVSAPGKLFVIGEYAVLEGSDAIVSAVNRRVQAQWLSNEQPVGETPQDDEMLRVDEESQREEAQRTERPQIEEQQRTTVNETPEVAEARRLAQDIVGVVPGHLRFDDSALRGQKAKFGLGSSAAKAACSAGAVFAWHQHDLNAPSVRQQVLECALAGHAAVSPSGSGADVVASVLGGFIHFARSNGQLGADPLPKIDKLVLRVVWTGTPASTHLLVQQVRAFQRRAPEKARAHISELANTANAFLKSWRAQSVTELIETASAYGKRMGALGAAADAPIVTESLEKIAALAQQHGGSAKPSGAGGGDIAIAFFGDESQASAFSSACDTQGFATLGITLGEPGLQITDTRA